MHLREVVRAGPIIGTDDTTVTLAVNESSLPSDSADTAADLNPKNVRAREVIVDALAEHRGSITARMWTYRSLTQPINVFDFTVSRHRDGPELFLDGFTGSLMADCYSGYEAVRTRSDGRIIRAACASHARRKAFEASNNDPVRAAVLLAMFGELYDIEDRARLMSAGERHGLRQAEAKPVWERMRAYLASDAVAGVMPKESFGKAITYIRNQFEHLLVYLDDGLMPIDNNETEQLMKQVALGRKNSYDLLSTPRADVPYKCPARAVGLNRIHRQRAAPPAGFDGRSNSYSGIGYPRMKVRRAGLPRSGCCGRNTEFLTRIPSTAPAAHALCL